MRRAIALIAGLAILGLANWTVAEREALLAEGRVVLLELAPVDPRSLLQGDYMALRFKLVDDAFGRGPIAEVADGRLVVRLDGHGVGVYARLDDGRPPAPGEALLRYRIREGQVKLATNAFFFQEGHGGYYAAARYGELRVSPSGDLLLTHLIGEDYERLGPLGP
jgi:uncharacterized membrane-anchored protein